MSKAPERGQATVEFALMLPLVFAILGICMQVVGVGLDQLAISHFAREVARKESVDSGLISPPPPERLKASRLRTTVRQSEGMVTASVSYSSQLTLPMTGLVLLRPQLHSRSVMWVEHRA